MTSNLIDSTTLHGVESLFRDGPRDPWGPQMAGKLADLFIYSERLRYPVPVRAPGNAYELAKDNLVLSDLVSRDSDAFERAEYSTAEPRTLAEEYLEDAFLDFSAWARARRFTLVRWLELQHTGVIQQRRLATTGTDYTFNLEKLSRDPRITSLASELRISVDDVCYTFDSILKFPLFGELTGEHAHYLNHPIRDAFILPTMHIEPRPAPPVAVVFGHSVTAIAPKLSRDDYTVLLHTLRGLVRKHGLHRVRPGQVDDEVLREIAAEAQLPPRITALGKTVGVIGGVIGGLGAFATLGPYAALIEEALTVSTSFWTGTVPRATARVKWLRWALEWDVERQMRGHQE